MAAVTVVLCSLSSLSMAEIKIKVETILKAYENNLTMTTDARAKVVLTQQKAGQGVKEMEAMWYRRDRDKAFLLVMLAPESDKGVGYLRVKDNFWMYRPNTRTFQHINRDESIGGSNVRAENFENRKFTEFYEGLKDDRGNDSISTEMLGKIKVYKFPLRAKITDVDYQRKVYYARTDNFLLLKEEDYSGSGTHMLTIYYLKYTQIDGKYVPINQIYVDEFEKGNKTIFEISGISTKKINNQIFTKAYLENLSK
jgi:hypothetical protein